jgi:cysteinyl-tRNA synthetase
MQLKLYDTLTRKERFFTPIDPSRVRMYVCGPTVYDFAHIGNARPVIVFDFLFRLLRQLYGTTHVIYVRNITDVDDKINTRAAEEYPHLPLNEAIHKVTETTEKQFHKDVDALGCLRPTFEPRATEHIEAMKVLIERLVAQGCAYVAEEHVLFSVPSMPDYGELWKQPLDQMIAGARVEVAPYKRDPMDFVLWKPSKPGEPAWPSPCGIATPGRPGWHIECSAMAWKHLGKTFDIHGGGIDLIFPHHENEIAQTRCAFHSLSMANFWVHNEFLQVEGRKMAKSEGNFITIHDLLNTDKFGGRNWSGEVVRFAMLQTHYRQPLDWTVLTLEQSEARLKHWKAFAAERTIRRHAEDLRNHIVAAMCDDLKTSTAFGLIDQACSDERPDERNRYTVYWMLKFLGFSTEQAPAAKAVEAISPIVRNIQHLSQRDWLQFFTEARRQRTRKPTPETSLLASVQALGKLENSLRRKQAVDWLQAVDAAQTSSFARPKVKKLVERWILNPGLESKGRSRRLTHSYKKKLKTLDAQKALESTIFSIASLGVNDWKNVVVSFRQEPTFSSGEPKPEAKLLAYLFFIGTITNSFSRLPRQKIQSVKILKLQEQIFHKISPKESPLDRRIRKLIKARNAARSAKDFQKADSIRDQLVTMGVLLKDSKEGTTWEIPR